MNLDLAKLEKLQTDVLRIASECNCRAEHGVEHLLFIEKMLRDALKKTDANDSTPEPSAHCPNCGSKDHNIGGCQEPLQSCEQSETFDWRQAAKLWAEGVEIQLRVTPICWKDVDSYPECIISFGEFSTYRRKPEPSPATPDKKEEWGLPAENQTVHNPSCAYLLGRIENLESVVRKFISKSEYEKVRHQ